MTYSRYRWRLRPHSRQCSISLNGHGVWSCHYVTHTYTLDVHLVVWIISFRNAIQLYAEKVMKPQWRGLFCSTAHTATVGREEKVWLSGRRLIIHLNVDLNWKHCFHSTASCCTMRHCPSLLNNTPCNRIALIEFHWVAATSLNGSIVDHGRLW